MTDSKHTRGQWVIDHADNLIHASDDRKTLIFNFGVTLKNPSVMADARLIAAAPDMLAALQRAVACGMVPATSANDGGAAKYSEMVQVADAIRAAIAKATGVQHG